MARIFKTPFGAQGDTEQVPEAPQGDGSVSLTQGFGYDYEREYEDPAAKDIRREVMNGLFHDITEAIGDIQLSGIAKWDAAAAPYPAGAVVWHNSVAWISRVGNNSADPVDGGDWFSLVKPSQFGNYVSTHTYQTGDIVRGSDGQFYEFYDRAQAGTTQGVDPTNAANRPHIWMQWDGVKPGSTIEWRSTSLPEGYVENDGSTINRADYRRVFAAIGTTYGAGNGSTTFRLPDDRGEFKRGLDRGRGVDAGRGISAHQSDEIKSHGHRYRYRFNSTSYGASLPRGSEGGELTQSASDQDVLPTGGSETRPRNNAVIYLTKI